MSGEKKIVPARWGVSLTLMSLLGVMTTFELGVNSGWNAALKISCLVLLVLLFVSYAFGFIKTGLWSFTHKPVKDLDEREMQLTGRSLRIAYAVFSVIVLVVLYVFALLEIKISAVLAAGLLLFAHLLPGAIITYSVKELRF